MNVHFDKKHGELARTGVQLGEKRGQPEVLQTTSGSEAVHTYSGGAIYLRETPGNVQTFAVWGDIYAKWQASGGVHGPLGVSHTDELPTPDKRGRFNHFNGGSVYWTPQTGAHIVWGAIRALWSQLGWERNPLGYPTTDEVATPKPKDYGRFNHFEHGSIYWTPTFGAQYVPEDIFREWAKSGHERHAMGFPIPKEQGKKPNGLPNSVSADNVFYFEGGVIFRDKQKVVALPTQLELKLGVLKCDDTEDTFGSDECRLEIFADGQKVADPRRNLKEGQSWNINRTVRFGSNAVIKLWDEDSPDSDDFLGQIDVATTPGDHLGRFRRDGADYTLSYSVVGQTVQHTSPSHVIVELLDVICHDTEDTTGADELYLVGATRVGSHAGAAVTKPMRINDGERRGFLPDERVLYDGPIGADDEIAIGLLAYDQDAAVDWNKHGPEIQKAVTGLADAVKKLDNPKVKIGAEIADKSVGLLGALIKLDEDDELGRTTLSESARDLPIGVKVRNWEVQGRWGGGFLDFSRWHYNVTLRITARA